MNSPDIIFGSLFEAVQMGHVFPDSKTFVDCTPKVQPAVILDAFTRLPDHQADTLLAFVQEHFDMPAGHSTTFTGDTARPIRTHIALLWKVLMREADIETPGSSLIPLPRPYIVPGGRFGEIYYWDSYFTMLGLAVSGHLDIIESMLDNFAYLIDTVGYIPNGNRTYFIGRSQPPFFSLMVLLLMRYAPERRPFAKYLGALEKEYSFWMDQPTMPRRAVTIDHRIVMNRYWDDRDNPRQESHREDVELAGGSDRNASTLYRDIRAACESGWDFSSRWLADGLTLATIETTNIIPVDLNCLMYAMEVALQKTYEAVGQASDAQRMQTIVENRVENIQQYLWDDQRSVFCDFHMIKGKPTGVDSLAMLFPLYVQIATQEQADAIAVQVEKHFLQPGGLLTSLVETGQQWDAPNGWAPLQWVTYQGLRNYGHDALARTCAHRWVDNCKRVYLNTGKFVEKYNVMDITLDAGGGEYPVQDGFGWTNGVMLKMMDELQNDR